jgi:hypothetical protein
MYVYLHTDTDTDTDTDAHRHRHRHTHRHTTLATQAFDKNANCQECIIAKKKTHLNLYLYATN